MRFAKLARLELRMALADGALRWVLGTALLLLLFAAWNGWQWRQFRSAAIQAVQEEAEHNAAVWLADMDLHEQGLLDPGYERPDTPYFVYAFFPWYAAAAPAPLSVLAVGQTDLHPYYAVGTMVTPNLLYHEEEIQNPTVLALGRFDLAFFLVVVLPVLIIALGFDLIAEDRRSGRDRLLALQAGGVAGVVALRSGLRFMWLTLVIVPTLALLLVATGGAATPESRVTLLLVLGLTVAYIALWFGLAVLVNARGASATRNAVLLLAMWGGTTLFAPAVIDASARARHPMSAGALRPAEERRMMQSIDDSVALERLATYEQLNRDVSPDVARETGWVASLELRRDTTAAGTAAMRAVVLERQRFADRLALAFPALVLYRALEDAAAASNDHAAGFQATTAASVRERAGVARANVLAGRPVERDRVAYLAGTAFQSVRTSESSQPPWLHLGVLCVMTLVSAGAAAMLLRHDERSRA